MHEVDRETDADRTARPRGVRRWKTLPRALYSDTLIHNPTFMLFICYLIRIWSRDFEFKRACGKASILRWLESLIDETRVNV